MGDQASQAIHKAFACLQVKTLTGVLRGPVELTPPEVRRTKGIRLMTPRAKLGFDKTRGTSVLRAFEGVSHGEAYTTHIFKGGLDFPEQCAECSREVHDYEVVEVTEHKKSLGGRAAIPGVSQEEATRIGTAMTCDRYWHALPFCVAHSVSGRSVHLPEPDKIEVTNRDFAQELAGRNDLKGKWIGRSHLIRQLVGSLGLIIGGGLAGACGAVIYQRLKSGDWGKASAEVTGWADNVLVISLVIGILILVPAIFAGVKGLRGEPLEQGERTALGS